MNLNPKNLEKDRATAEVRDAGKTVHARNAKGQPICNANREFKNMEPCQSTYISANGRCKQHGGATLKGPALPQFVDGKTSKYSYLPKPDQARYEQLTGDVIDNLEESVTIQKVFETELLEKKGTGESGVAWQSLKDLWNQYDQAKPGEHDLILRIMRNIIMDGVMGEQLRSDVQNIQETQRKLAETIIKCRKEQQETFTMEQYLMIMNLVVGILRKYVTDKAKLQQAVDDIAEYQNKSPLLLTSGAR